MSENDGRRAIMVTIVNDTIRLIELSQAAREGELSGLFEQALSKARAIQARYDDKAARGLPLDGDQPLHLDGQGEI